MSSNREQTNKFMQKVINDKQKSCKIQEKIDPNNKQRNSECKKTVKNMKDVKKEYNFFMNIVKDD